jgi:hypothetical protein
MILGHLVLSILVGLLSGAIFIAMGHSLWTVMLFYCVTGNLSLFASFLLCLIALNRVY